MNFKASSRLLSLVFILMVVWSCRSRQPAQSTDPFAEFMSFYDQFHQDSIFQVEHVLFPLEGLPSNSDSALFAAGDFRWQKEDWLMHRPFDFQNSDYQRQFVPFDDNLIMERIEHESGEYALERRWAKIEGNWYLIYYAGLNRVQ